MHTCVRTCGRACVCTRARRLLRFTRFPRILVINRHRHRQSDTKNKFPFRRRGRRRRRARRMRRQEEGMEEERGREDTKFGLTVDLDVLMF